MTGTNCDLFTHKSVPVIFEPPCIFMSYIVQRIYSMIRKGLYNMYLVTHYFRLAFLLLLLTCTLVTEKRVSLRHAFCSVPIVYMY
jgi:hypothetical protein